jgi:hypothetical protein
LYFVVIDFFGCCPFWWRGKLLLYMNSVLTDIFLVKKRKPETVVLAFLARYNRESVFKLLALMFAHYTLAVSAEGKPMYDEQLAGFITLFDEVIALTGALEELQQKGAKGKCIFCNGMG